MVVLNEVAVTSVTPAERKDAGKVCSWNPRENRRTCNEIEGYTGGTLLFRYLRQKRIRREAGHLTETKRTAVVMEMAPHVGVGAIYSRRECGEKTGLKGCQRVICEESASTAIQ
jgi:hypothetical protein